MLACGFQKLKVLVFLTGNLAIKELLPPGQLLVCTRAIIHICQPNFDLIGIQ
jgi:hypothetical protein